MAALGAAANPPPVCPTCLEPILEFASPRHARVAWPACGHHYHLSCLARMRAQLAHPACALCRQPWPPAQDDLLSHTCNHIGLNPFIDSEAEGRPPAPAAPLPTPAAPLPDNLALRLALRPLTLGCSGRPGPSRYRILASLPMVGRGSRTSRRSSRRTAAPPPWSLSQNRRPLGARWLAAPRSSSSIDPGRRLCPPGVGPSSPATRPGIPVCTCARSCPPMFRRGPPRRRFGPAVWCPPCPAGPNHSSRPLACQSPFWSGHRARPRTTPCTCKPTSSHTRSRGSYPRPCQQWQRASRHGSSPATAWTPGPRHACRWPRARAGFGLEMARHHRHRRRIRRPHPHLPKCATMLRRGGPSGIPHFSHNAFQGTPASPATIHRAWKLFLLTPRLLFHRPPGPGRLERGALCQRADDFLAGRWPALLTSACACRVTRPAPPSPTTDVGKAATRRRLRACSQVQSGDLSRARATLTSSPLAPGTAATLEALRDPNRRPPTLQRPIPEEVLTSCTPAPVQLSARELADSLRTAKRGAAPGLSGATAEHYKLLLEDPAAFQLFVSLANALAQAVAPADILQALSLARLTALQKPGGGVRGIATGDALCRLVSRTLARHFADVLDQATRPFQFALKARAGTDALAGLITAALDLDPECTVVSLDGRAAYDSISRAAFLSQVRSSVPSLLPFAKAFYGQTSTYYWWDDGGTRHTIAQGEGCEQGDALAPALFALGQHAGLLAAATQLQPGETLAAYLDDLYILTSPTRARTCLDAVSRAVHAHSGIAANLGKTRVFHRAGGPPPPGIRDLGPDVWCGGEQPPEECGFLALGTPIGTPAYVQGASADRLRRQADFLRELPHLPDLQAAWLLLTYCAAPRAQHLLRTVPPTLSRLRRRTTRPSGRRWPGCFKSRPPRPYLFPPGPWLSYQPDWAA